MQKKLLTTLSLFLLFVALPVLASGTYFESESNEISRGQLFKADFFLNTEGKDINAIEGRVIFPSENLELKQTIEANSIVNFWIEKPEVKSGNQIIFSGGLPGGFTGDRGFLFSMVFRAKDNIPSGEIKLTAENVKVFLNDGSGTGINVSSVSFSFSVIDGKRADVEVIEDTNLPELFVPYIGRNPTLYDNQWFIAFTAQDKELGIDHYEVWETAQKYDINNISNTKGINWTESESPHLLEDQNLQSYIYVKAVDKAGNERIAVILPGKSKKTDYKNAIIAVLVILLAILGSVFAQRILKYFRNKIQK